MTELTAKTIGLQQRGRLAPGFKADILIFDESQIKATANYEDPYQLAKGFDDIIINGQLVREQGQWKDLSAGRILRKTMNKD